MTQEETRQLGIEFERRIQTMIPEKEFLNKLDTETIYSFLNQYQDKYIQTIYKNLDGIPSGSKISARIESILQSLITSEDLTLTDNNSGDTLRSDTYNLPDNFCMYIRSTSNASSVYSYKKPLEREVTLSNQLISQIDAQKLIEAPHDDMRILRHPLVVLGKNNTIDVIHDRYTTITGIKILYYKNPVYFSTLTDVNCELPLEAFDDLVTGAIDLYVQYVAGAEANKRRQDEARKQQANRNRQNNEEDD